MKKFNINPLTGEPIEMEESKWKIVVVHYEGFITEKYRAVKYNEDKAIIAERTFNAKEMAEAYIDHQS